MKYRCFVFVLAVQVVLAVVCLFVPCHVMSAGLFSFIGDVAKGVTGIGTALFGGIKSGKERKKAARALDEARGEIEKEKAFNDTLFNREYYQDFLQRSENQAALRSLREVMKRDNQAAAQTAVVTGATQEAVAKQKEVSNQSIGSTISSIAANSSSVRDNVMSRYLNYRNNLTGQVQNVLGQKMNLHNQNAVQWSNLMQNGLNALSSSFSSDKNGNGGLGNLLSSLLNK